MLECATGYAPTLPDNMEARPEIMPYYQAIFWSPVCLFPHFRGKHGQVQGYLTKNTLRAFGRQS